jgi:hypothetical protein
MRRRGASAWRTPAFLSANSAAWHEGKRLLDINELGDFLARTKAQYLVSMPTSSDVAQCGEWLSATWISTKSPGGFDGAGRPVLAPPVKLNFSNGTRDGW